jgi:hypothetical protein
MCPLSNPPRKRERERTEFVAPSLYSLDTRNNFIPLSLVC